MEILHKKYNLFQKERSSSQSRSKSRSSSLKQDHEQQSPSMLGLKGLKSTLKAVNKESDDFFNNELREKSVSFNQITMGSDKKIKVGELEAPSDCSETNEWFGVKRKRAYTEIENGNNNLAIRSTSSHNLTSSPPKSKSKKSKSISRPSKSYKSYDSEKTPLIKEEDPGSQSSGRNPKMSSDVKPF